MSDMPVPKSEAEEARGTNKWLYKLMGWLGLTSGVGLIALGGWWFMWCLGMFLSLKPQNALQESVHENYFNQAELGAILVALGVVIMEIKRLRND